MKTLTAVLLNIGLIFASVFSVKIKNPELQNATALSLAAIAAVAAKMNSDTDPKGNPINTDTPKQ